MSQRWFIDFAKFKAYLEGKYQPLFLKFYGTQDVKPRGPKFQARAQAEANRYSKLVQLGYDVVVKPLKYIKRGDGTFTTKGDMDVEMTMGILDNLDSLDMIVLISGDSDYLPLMERAYNKEKEVSIMSFDQLLSWELRTFAEDNKGCSYTKIESLRPLIEK